MLDASQKLGHEVPEKGNALKMQRSNKTRGAHERTGSNSALASSSRDNCRHTGNVALGVVGSKMASEDLHGKQSVHAQSVKSNDD